MIAEALASLFTGRAPYRGNATLENPRFSLNDPAAYEALTGGSQSAAGVVVTHEKSLGLAAVWQALCLISGDGSKLPVYPFERLPDNDREIADKHQSYVAVALRANPWKSAKRFWADLIVHMLLWRNGYAFINRVGPRLELYNLLPDRTVPKWVQVLDPKSKSGLRSELIYETEVAGKIEIVMPSNILHVRQWSLDGLVAPDLVAAAKDSWGLALAAQNFESKFFKNGARKGGILELPAAMGKGAKDTVEEGFRKSYEDGDNPFRTVILREGAKFHEGQVNPREGQVVELKDSQKREIASYFNIPPSKLGIRDSMSYNSFEQDNLSYLHGCLHHTCDAISDECDMKLLSEPELLGDKFFFEHNYSEFIQADWESLTTGLKTLREGEFINANEGRRKLNLPRRKDKGGEDYQNPNTKSAESQKPQEPPKKTKPSKEATDAHRRLFVDAFGRMARRVAFDARTASKDSKKFTTWIDSEAAKHKSVFIDAVRPVSAAYTSVFGGDDAAMTNKAESGFFTEVMGLSAFLDAPHAAVDLQTNVSTYLDTFERTSPERLAASIMEPENV
jgi:HK97 family phage portal protein